MAIRKRNEFLGLMNSYFIDSPQPSNLSYWWNLGSLLGLCLIIQILTGVFLAMHYSSNIELAFLSVEHIMRDVNYGWAIRYCHANGASFFFIFVYMHIAKGIYYGSYKSPRSMVWYIGVIIFLIMIITGFLGYCLVYGQMSHWGATVITNLVTAIPLIGTNIAEFIWGASSVSNATLQRFFSLHYLFPFLLAALILMHLLALHTNGSSNPLGITGNMDRIPFHPYFVFKDLITVFVFLLVYSIMVFYYPNMLGDVENYIAANPLVTPTAIVPEFYLLPFYAILRSIPNKLLGVVFMLAAILILLLLPTLDKSIIRGNTFRILSKLFYGFFICNFLLLGVLGAQHIEAPYILLGQISTMLYFAHFLIFIPLISILENTLFYINSINS